MLTTSLCLMQGVLYELLIGFEFVVLFLSVLLIATCGRLSWPATLWTTFGRTINSDWLCDWLIDQFLKVFFVIIAFVLYTVYVFYVRTGPVRSQHVAPRCTLRNSRPRSLVCFWSEKCPHHRVQRPRFPIHQMHIYWRVTFTVYSRCFCATTVRRMTLWPATKIINTKL